MGLGEGKKKDGYKREGRKDEEWRGRTSLKVIRSDFLPNSQLSFLLLASTIRLSWLSKQAKWPAKT